MVHIHVMSTSNNVNYQGIKYIECMYQKSEVNKNV